jgi:hypothetical protein
MIVSRSSKIHLIFFDDKFSYGPKIVGGSDVYSGIFFRAGLSA